MKPLIHYFHDTRTGPRRLRIWSAIGLIAAICAGAFGLLTAQTEQLTPGPPTVGLVLQPWGFEPSEVTVKAGPIRFDVYNRVGFAELALRIDREEQGSRTRTNVQQERLKRERKSWDRVLDLPPGIYTVSEESHPEWICTVTVSN